MKRSRKIVLALLSAVVLAASFPLGVVTGEYFSLDNRLRRTAYRYIEKYYFTEDSITQPGDLVPWSEGVVSEVGQPFRPDIETILAGKDGEIVKVPGERPPMYQVSFDDPKRSGLLGPVNVWVLKEDFSFVGFMPRQ